MGNTDDEILRMFIEESREHLADIENDLLVIEEGGADIDDDLVNKVFRAAHSLKGGAGFFHLVNIKDLAHKIENVLDMIRSRELVPNPEVINILLIAFDKLKELVDNVTESNNIDISEFIVSLTGLSSSYLPKEEKESIKKTLDIRLNGKTVMKVPEFDIAHARKRGDYIYIVQYDLIHDVQRVGKTPLDIIRNMLETGTILECLVDISVVGTLEDEPSNQIPFYVLFATIIEPDIIGSLFELDQERIQVFSGDGKTQKQPEVTGGSTMSVNTMEPIFSQHSVIVPEDNVPAHAGSERGKPQQQAGTSIQHQKAPAQQGALSGPPDASLRVNVHLLDSLMNLAGELVLSRNQLLEAVSHNDRRALRASGQRINLVTSELQEAIMLTRMQPIGNIFNKFPRVVRDLTKDLGKEVRLEMDGKEVELDKTIVEGLSDPLTHLVRNAVDHGIETQEVRVKAGKDPTGTIRLKAYHEAGQVNIEIQDEGAGIDPGKIAATAVSRGLISHDQVKAMSDKERIALILLPGLSTAEKVTDLSGRGVGMDVVKTNLDKLGGQVDIESDMGRGTRFKIKLPLTLAIIPSLLVSVNGERFAVPQVNVDELIRVAASQVDERIEKVGDAQVLILRGKLIPIVHLADCMGIQRTFEDPISGERRPDRRVQAAGRRSRKAPLFEDPSRLPEEEKKDGRPDGNERRSGPDRRYHANSDLSIVVVTAGAFQYGLVVEALHDNIEIVVKPLGRHLKHLKQYAGATIMGDGRVALILDVAGLAQVIGLSSLAGSSRAVELGKKAQQEKSQDIHSFLLFRNGPDEQCAVPLDLVERVEQVKASAIEQVGGRRVMRYRGESMPLLALKDVAMVQDLPDQDDLIVIVFNLSGKAIGLLATPPVDTIETRTAMDESTLKQKGIMGSCIIDNRTTLIVDIFDLIESLHPGWFKGRDRRDLKKNNSHAILLAEDSDFFRSQVKRFLEEGGNNVIAAEDGAAAWNLLQEKGDEVKLVVTDVEMPNLDGYGLARNIKGNERFSHLPVIALTSLAGDEDLAKGKAAGFDEYLIKLDKEKLQETVSVFFQHSHERK